MIFNIADKFKLLQTNIMKLNNILYNLLNDQNLYFFSFSLLTKLWLTILSNIFYSFQFIIKIVNYFFYFFKILIVLSR